MNKIRCSLILSTLLSFSQGASSAALPFSDSFRHKYVQDAILEFRTAKAETIIKAKELVDLFARDRCRSLFDTVMLDCLRKEAETQCGNSKSAPDGNCQILWDVTIVNLFNEKQFISRGERFEISSKSEHFNADFAKALHTKYAILATQMLFDSNTRCEDSDAPCQASKIDDFCVNHGDANSLPWQGCAAALAWFVGTNR